jgi:hypothetical protein
MVNGGAAFPQPDVCPDEGASGEFRMTMYRGTSSEPRHTEFASDPGDYGRGAYWSATQEHASIYGPVIIARDIYLKNALRLSPAEVRRMARESGATVMENGYEERLAAANRFTAQMKDKGYDGIVVCGYETFDLWSACVF